MQNFLNLSGLINATSKESSHVNENSFLYSLEYLYLHNGFHSPSSDSNELRANMLTYLLEDVREYVGRKIVYRNVLRGTGLPQDQYLSRDQMIAYAIFSMEMGLGCHYEIYTHIKNHYMTYDNTTAEVNFKRIVMPWDVIFIGLLCNSKWAKRFFWVLKLKMLDTFKRGGTTETSGEILCWVQIRALLSCGLIKKDFIDKCDRLLEKRFGTNPMAKVFSIYFPEPGHPNRCEP